MKEDLRATLAIATGFVFGVAMTAYLVLGDPEVRMLFRAKSNRMKSAGWTGIAQEVARHTIMEMREAFPRLIGQD